MPRPESTLLFTCEHAGCRVPDPWRHLFRGQRAVLASHRGWDPGALAVARGLARATAAPLVATSVTRLLVDANRSPHNPAVFSELTRALPHAEREALLARFHRPHWDRVRAEIARLSRGGARVVHVGVHSFTPHWRGRDRAFDVAFLYDPKRRGERAFCAAWRERLRGLAPDLRIRRNAPYRGAADGLTTALRRELPARGYLGIELELSQRSLAAAADRWRLVRVLARSLAVPPA